MEEHLRSIIRPLKARRGADETIIREKRVSWLKTLK